MTDIHHKSVAVLDQLGAVVAGMPDGPYSQPISCLQGNSLGKHVRHIVEFFECLLEGLPTGIVNYDLRKRNLRIETETRYTLSLIASIQKQIASIQDGPLLLQADLGSGIQPFQTSVFRELAFAMDHSIHHLALIRVGIQQHFPEIPLSDELGIAFSTLRYLQEQKS